jgi:hypothetical protein
MIKEDKAMITQNQMKPFVFAFLLIFSFSLSTVIAQNDTLYFMKNGIVVNKQSIKETDVDSIIFYKPVENYENGYYSYNGWNGYAWIGKSNGATVVPADFSLVTTNGPFCASGTVPPDPAFSEFVMIGFNINQEMEANAEVNTLVPTNDILVVNVSSTGGNISQLYVQLQAPGGYTDANKRWCKVLTDFNQDLHLTLSDFNTRCWDNSGTYYANQPIEVVGIVAPGDYSVPRDFNICVNKIGPK